MADKYNKPHRAVYLYLFLISFFIVLISANNPFNFRPSPEDSFFSFTNFITAPGIYLAGIPGLWITELIFMFISVCFAWKTALFFANPFISFLGCLFSFIILLGFYTANTGAEVFSLPFLMISLYLYVKYFMRQRREILFTELIILGFCFASAILIRFSLFPLWLGFGILIFLDLLFRRRFFLICRYINGFFIGTLIVFIPLYLYLRLEGIFDLIFSQHMENAAASLNGLNFVDTVRGFYSIIGSNFSFIPLIYGILFIIINFKSVIFYFYFAYSISYFLMILLLAFSGGSSQNNIVLVPFFIAPLTFFINIIYTFISRAGMGVKFRSTALVLFLCIVFSEGILGYIYEIIKLIYK